MSRSDLPDLPAVECEKCGHDAEPSLEVRRLSASTDEYRYCCAACGHPIVVAVLGDADDVDARQAELAREGMPYGVKIDVGKAAGL